MNDELDEVTRASGRGGPFRVDVSPSSAVVVPGEPVGLMVEVSNTDDVIRQVSVAVLGLDKSWVTVEPSSITLFPEERSMVAVIVKLPPDFPAGKRDAAIEVTDESDPTNPAIVSVTLSITPRDKVEVRMEPSTIITGRKASFSSSVLNKGNTTVEVSFVGSDPEGILTTRTVPETITVHPGGEAVVRVEVSGKRPWLGTPLVRQLTLEARAKNQLPDQEDDAPEFGSTDLAMGTVVQKPWLSRGMLSMCGLLLAALVFGGVFTVSLGKVAKVAKSGEELLKKSLDKDAAGAHLPPVGIGGTVTSATGSGLDGVAVELYDVAHGPLLATRASVTDPAGVFLFASLPAATYKLKIIGAGFGEIWYPKGVAFDSADDLVIEAGKGIEGLAVKLAGLPAELVGAVVGPDVAGAIVTVRVPSSALPGGQSAVVKSFPVDAAGIFDIADLPTPASYELSASKVGMTSEVRTISLTPGQTINKLSLLLRPGDGVVSGQVVDRTGQPIPSAKVTITDGTLKSDTITLSGAADIAGTFELRDLQTPSTQSLTVSAPGFLAESQTLKLDKQQILSNVRVVLVSSEGQLGGHITGPTAAPLGNVSISVVGSAGTRTTSSLTAGDVGSWLLPNLAVPGSYTVTFSSVGYVSQTQAVNLGLDAPSNLAVDMKLTAANASVRGLIRELGTTDPATCNTDDIVVTDCPGHLAGVLIKIANSTVNRQTLSADIPTGSYRFDDLPPGAYTVSFSRIGSTPQTLFVEVVAGEVKLIDDIQLEPQARILGKLTTNGLPAANVGVKVYRIGDYPNKVAFATVSDANGHYEVIGLDAPETYVIEFQVPAGGPVQSSTRVFLRPGEVGNGDATL